MSPPRGTPSPQGPPSPQGSPQGTPPRDPALLPAHRSHIAVFGGHQEPQFQGDTALTTSPWWSPFSAGSWDTPAGRPGRLPRCRGESRKGGIGSGIAPRNNPHPKKGLCGAGKAQLGPGWGDKDVTPAPSTPPTPIRTGFSRSPAPGMLSGRIHGIRREVPTLELPRHGHDPARQQDCGNSRDGRIRPGHGPRARIPTPNQHTNPQTRIQPPKPTCKPPNQDTALKTGDTAPKTGDTTPNSGYDPPTWDTAPRKPPAWDYGPGDSDTRDPPDSGKGTGGFHGPKDSNMWDAGEMLRAGLPGFRELQGPEGMFLASWQEEEESGGGAE